MILSILLTRFSGAVILAAACHFTAMAQLTLVNVEPQTKTKLVAEGTNYRYVFENDRFTTPRVEVEFNQQGTGKFRFVRKDGQDIENDLQVTEFLAGQVQSIFNELRFLESKEDYQYKKDFSHLGQIKISLMQGGRERTASFNYTDNPALNRLVDIFRNIATQETRVFELETVRSTDPLSTPAQLRLLDNDLRSKRIAEPQRLLPILQEIKMDGSVPLIARNHSERLISFIKKGK
jgi:hypothetical protein